MHEEFIPLQGRLIALELLMDGFITHLVARDPNPSESLRVLKEAMVNSLQHISRPVDEVSDAIWAEAVGALELRFNNVANRLERRPAARAAIERGQHPH